MKFSDIPGQHNVKEALRSMVETHRIPHAIMLSGVSGIGKMALARAFMQYVHCQSPRDGEPCGECPSCRQHLSFNHPDVHFFFPMVKNKSQNILSSADRLEEWKKMLTNHRWMPEEKWIEILNAGNSRPVIYVNDAEEIVRADAYSSYNSGYKFFLMWLPEKLNPDAANKLLKVIEEPSEGTIFILVSNNSANVLPTISSRTRRLNMLPPSPEELEKYIMDNYNLDYITAHSIARIAQGQISKAEELASDTGERQEFGNLFKEIMRAAYGKKPGKLKAIADNAAGMGREKLHRFFSYMTSMARENFIYNLKIPALTYMTPDEESFSDRFSPYIHHGNVEDLVKVIEKADMHVERNGNSKLILFSLFLEIIPLLHRSSKQ